jgi:hypothetical protein
MLSFIAQTVKKIINPITFKITKKYLKHPILNIEEQLGKLPRLSYITKNSRKHLTPIKITRLFYYFPGYNKIEKNI